MVSVRGGLHEVFKPSILYSYSDDGLKKQTLPTLLNRLCKEKEYRQTPSSLLGGRCQAKGQRRNRALGSCHHPLPQS